MELPKNIIEAYQNWKAAEDSVPEFEWQKDYKYRLTKAFKLWMKFSLDCEAAGLDNMEVASSFVNKTICIK